MNFKEKKKHLEYAAFWLGMAERATESLNALMNMERPHLFWTDDELSEQIGRFTDIVAYCLLRYQLSLEKAK